MQGNIMEYPHKIRPEMLQDLRFRILKMYVQPQTPTPRI